jgi:undecaprenol kinase
VKQRRNGKGNIMTSFKMALYGIAHALRHERNMKIHSVAALLVIILAAVLKVSFNDWMILLLLIALVISLELVNTAVERTVDLFTQERHPLAKQAKDTAAGAVLVMVIISVIIGIGIFLKYL